jgi:hypothetical protein
VDASNAKCPSVLRVESQALNATVSLLQDGRVVKTGTGSSVVFEGLGAAQYTIKVEADGFKTYETPSGKLFETPRNKNISVYLSR